MRVFVLPLLLAAVLADPAAAEVRVRVAATDPPAEATLGRGEPFYVRVQVETDAPANIWVRPYRGGRPVVDRGTRTNASAPHRGAGYALGWFSLDDPGTVDELRVVVGGGSPYREWTAAAQPVALRWTADPPAARGREPWVDALARETDAAMRRAAQERAAQPARASDSVLAGAVVILALAVLVAGLAGPAWAVWAWRGRWRIAAAGPAGLMAFVVLRLVVDTARDPTSHNLWPFELVMWGAVAAGATGLLALGRRLARAAVS